MAILDEIRNEILKNSELDGNEKICLIALLCSGNIGDLDELADLMGVTKNTSQMTIRSLRLKGYLKDSQPEADEAEITALRKLMAREKNMEFRSREESAYEDEEDNVVFAKKEAPRKEAPKQESSERELTRSQRAEKLSKVLDLSDENYSKNSYKSRAAALYKKDSNVAKAAKKIKDINMPNYGAEDVLGTIGVDQEHSVQMKSKPNISGERYLSLEDRVMDLVEESITRSEAAIILGFAGGDFEKVEATYKRIRGTQIKDKVDALVKLLQAD